MADRSEVSVVIPCYNAERTLAATIISALEQDADKEVIVVNDGSTDGSEEVIREFGLIDYRSYLERCTRCQDSARLKCIASPEPAEVV